jgi:hypothetical protein
MGGVSDPSRGKKATRRHVPGGRWLSVALRATHLMCVVALGAAVHGAQFSGVDARTLGLLVFGTGIALLGLDLYTYPHHLHEVAGQSVLVKLLLVAGIALSETARLPLFWLVVFWSAIFSHAPGSLRHRRLFGRVAD